MTTILIYNDDDADAMKQNEEIEDQIYASQNWHKGRCSECGKNRMVRTILRANFCEECEHCENADC